MRLPDVPLLYGDPVEDVQSLRNYLLLLQERLEEPYSTGWVLTGISADTTLTTADTLPQVINVLGTLIQVLLTKGLLQG